MEPAEEAEIRHRALQVLAGEGEVAGLLGGVDPHDPLHQRVQRRVGVCQHLALEVVDRVLPAQHEQEEQRREDPGQRNHEPLGQPPQEPGHAPHREPGTVHELLEHQGVLGLLDDLVVEVAELRRAIAKLECVAEQAPLEQVLEVPAGLHAGGPAVAAEAGPHDRRLRRVPVGVAQGVDGRQLEAGVGGVDGVGRVVPVDVGVGVEVPLDRQLVEPADHDGELVGRRGHDGSPSLVAAARMISARRSGSS